MTDRELLEPAAKAAGMLAGTSQFDWNVEAACFWRHEPDQDGISGPWNPLQDDGDAFRLATKLKMRIEHDVWIADSPHTKVRAQITHAKLIPSQYGRFPEQAKEFHDSDPYAATRRAIVRAAAEIGKDMP